MSDDRLTVSETRELLNESLSRAQDCAEDLVREVCERDETIARLTAELAEARATVREYFAAIEHDAPITVAFRHRCEAARAALRRLIEGDP